MSGLSILIAAISTAGLAFIECCERYSRVERARRKREAARAAEAYEFDRKMRRAIELERVLNEPVGVHMSITEKKPLRKATGLFSDAEAQRIIA